MQKSFTNYGSQNVGEEVEKLSVDGLVDSDDCVSAPLDPQSTPNLDAVTKELAYSGRETASYQTSCLLPGTLKDGSCQPSLTFYDTSSQLSATSQETSCKPPVASQDTRCQSSVTLQETSCQSPLTPQETSCQSPITPQDPSCQSPITPQETNRLLNITPETHFQSLVIPQEECCQLISTPKSVPHQQELSGVSTAVSLELSPIAESKVVNEEEISMYVGCDPVARAQVPPHNPLTRDNNINNPTVSDVTDDILNECENSSPAFVADRTNLPLSQDISPAHHSMAKEDVRYNEHDDVITCLVEEEIVNQTFEKQTSFPASTFDFGDGCSITSSSSSTKSEINVVPPAQTYAVTALDTPPAQSYAVTALDTFDKHSRSSSIDSSEVENCSHAATRANSWALSELVAEVDIMTQTSQPILCSGPSSYQTFTSSETGFDTERRPIFGWLNDPIIEESSSVEEEGIIFPNLRLVL